MKKEHMELEPIDFGIGNYGYPDGTRSEPQLTCGFYNISRYCREPDLDDIFKTMFWMWISGAMTEKEFIKYMEKSGHYPRYHRSAKKEVTE